MRKIKEIIFLFVCLIVLNLSAVFATDNTLTVGEYLTSGDVHKIVVSGDSTIKFDDTYTLTRKSNVSGDVLTGTVKNGSKNVSVTFYQLNKYVLLSPVRLTYTHNSVTTNLYDYTPFVLENVTATPDANGLFELWRDTEKINTYAELQDVVNVAESGDRIELLGNVNDTCGAYVGGKSLVIDGNGYELNSGAWINTIFFIDEDANLKLENIVIDGKATGFDVATENINPVTNTSINIPIVSGSDSKDVKRNLPVIISKGNLDIIGSEIANNYTTGNGTINIVAGKLNVENTKINHNRATKGGAIYIGSNFKVDETFYPVEEVNIKNSTMSENYSNGIGGAIAIYNTDVLNIDKCNFVKNICSGASGGALSVKFESAAGYYSKGEALGLDYIQIFINDTVFDDNWAGNDGFAIADEDAELVIKNTVFKNNVGVRGNGNSIATLSVMQERKTDINKHLVENCLFEGNKGACSDFGDHGTSNMTIEFINTDFKNNVSNYNSVLIYSSEVLFKNCNFVGDIGARDIIEIRPYRGGDGTPNEMTLENVNFIDTQNGCAEIFLREYTATDTAPYSIVIKGDVNADISLWNNNKVIIDGSLTGNIITDDVTEKSSIIVNEGGTFNGEIRKNNEKIYMKLMYPESGDYDFDFVKYVYVESQSSLAELFASHRLVKEGYTLEVYSDNKYTTKWDGSATNDKTIYGKWVEHEHVFGDELFVIDTMIVNGCSCGYFEEYIQIEEPTNIEYDGNSKEVKVTNLLEAEYTLSYEKYEDDTWVSIEESPINVSLYKAILTLSGDQSIEIEYEIEKATPKIKLNNLTQYINSIEPVTYTVLPKVTDGIVTVEYKLEDSEDESYTEELPTDIGNYLVKVSISEDSNLEDSEIVKTLIIKQKKVSSNKKTSYKIKVIKNIDGKNILETYEVSRGNDFIFDVEIYDNYEIEEILIDDEVVEVSESYSLKNVKEKHTIEIKYNNIESEWNNPFIDVSKEDWYYDAVKYVNENNLMNGMNTNEFGAKITTKRGMIVTILYRYSKEETNEKSIFNDVAENSYYSNAIAWANKNEIVKGIGENLFNPEGEITREQIVSILYRYAKFIGVDVNVGENTNILSYNDFEDISEYAIPAMQWACGSGIITGRTPSTIQPKGNATRAEVATMMMRFLSLEE